jgi:hypothetical protein
VRFPFKTLGAVAIVVASFFFTLSILDYLDRTTESASKELHPAVWRTFGKASYGIRGDTIVMRGPDNIYTETECDSSKCEVEFSIFIEWADAANLQLLFFDLRGTALAEPAIETITDARGRTVEIRAFTPPRTKTVRAIIYSPQQGDAVVFRDPVVRVRPSP